MKVKVINKSNNPLPIYSTKSSAGLDLFANNEEDIILAPLQRAAVFTGLFIEIPEGYEVQIRPRSGIAIKNGITVLNTPATIDADYRGEVAVILINLSNEQYTIKKGDRIAQMILSKFEKVEWENTIELSQTARGSGGFGHTGIN